MRLFGENVYSTPTQADYNILQVEGYEEIFFDVYQLKINGHAHIVEKVASYGFYPVVLCDVSLDPNVEELYPFILKKGVRSEVYFNENNINIPKVLEIVEESSDCIDDVDEDIDTSEIENIREAIEDAKIDAKLKIQKYVNSQLAKKQKVVSEHKEILNKVVTDAKSELLVEFLNATEKLKTHIMLQNENSMTESVTQVVNKLYEVEKNLKSQLTKKVETVSNALEIKLEESVKGIYDDSIVPILTDAFEKVQSELNEKATKTKVTEEISNVMSRVSKPISKLNARISETFEGVKIARADINILANSIENKISQKEKELKEYFAPKLESLESQFVDLSEETRTAIRQLIVESKDTLINEIRDVNNIIPVEYIIENSTGNNRIKKDDLDKQIDKKISDKVSSHVTELRKYIAVYSGGGSVAQQFANGGTMYGDLVIVGSISAAQYLGISGGGGGGGGSNVHGLSANWQNGYTTVQANSAKWNNTNTTLRNLSGNWQTTYTTVQANSANWQNTYTTVASQSSTWGSNPYLPLSGGTLSGPLTSSSTIATNDRLVVGGHLAQVPSGVTSVGTSFYATGNNFAFVGSNNNNNATRKFTRWGAAHYTNAEEPLLMMIGDSITSNTADLYIGGGTGLANAFQTLKFYTAATATTVTGTERLTINSNGVFTFNDPGNDCDFRIEAVGDPNAFFSDASVAKVGIGTNTPNEKLTVVGSISATENLVTTGDSNRLPNQTIATNDSILTRELADARYTAQFGLFGPNSLVRIDIPIGWTANAAVGGSVTYASGKTLAVQSSTTLDSQAYLRTSGYQPNIYTYPGEDSAGGNAGILWDIRTYYSFRMSIAHGSNSAPSAGHEGYIRFGTVRTQTQFGPLTSSGIGIQTLVGDVFGMVHDGSSLKLTSNPIYTTASGLAPVNLYEIIGDGAGSFSFYVNGTFTETLTGGPTGFSGQEGTATNLMVKNVTGGVATNSVMVIADGVFFFSYLA